MAITDPSSHGFPLRTLCGDLSWLFLFEADSSEQTFRATVEHIPCHAGHIGRRLIHRAGNWRIRVKRRVPETLTIVELSVQVSGLLVGNNAAIGTDELRGPGVRITRKLSSSDASIRL
nr:hypothetical protein Iba_chr13bCG9950 [Ipomoea batatas]